jgi:spermidine synthase
VAYLAAPVALYETPFYRQAEELLVEAGAALVISAKDRFENTATWLRDFPNLIHQIDVIVVALSPDRTIGTGLMWEILEGVVNSLPVYFLNEDRRFHPLHGVWFTVLDRPSRRCFARVEFPLRKRR